MEPQVGPFKALREKYRDRPEIIPLNLAISDTDSEMEFYTVRKGAPGLPPWAGQIASFRKDVILAHKPMIPNIEEMIEAHVIPCLSLRELFARHAVQELDMLQIDAEGYDAIILRSLDFGALSPAIIRYEHKHLSRHDQTQCTNLLVARGYHLFLGDEDTTAFLTQDFPPQHSS